MRVGDTVKVTVSPYVHIQREGCDYNDGCPDACGDEMGCFIKGLGCNCETAPTKRTTDVDTEVTKEGIVFIGSPSAVEEISASEETLAKMSDGTFTITAKAVGTTEVTIKPTLRDWVSTTKTYTVNVSEKTASVVDFDAETTHGDYFKDVGKDDNGNPITVLNAVQTLYVDLTFDKEMKIVNKAALLKEMNVLSDKYGDAKAAGKLENGNFVAFGAGLKPDNTSVELVNGNRTLKITTSGWGAQVDGIFRIAGTWKNLVSVDGEKAEVDETIIIPNGITVEIVDQTIATEDTNASITVKVIRPDDATRGKVHWQLLKNGEPVPALYNGKLGFNGVGATFNAHLHYFATDTAADFARNSASTMKPILSDYYDIGYVEGSDEITVTAKSSEPGDILQFHIYSYLNNGSKAANNDLSALNSVIGSAKALDKSGYTADSFAAVTDALAKAQLIANVPKYYAQSEIDFAAGQLSAAIDSLVKADKAGAAATADNDGKDKSGNDGNSKSDNGVKTGDEFPVGLFAVLMAAAACTAGGVLFRRKQSAK